MFNLSAGTKPFTVIYIKLSYQSGYIYKSSPDLLSLYDGQNQDEARAGSGRAEEGY